MDVLEALIWLIMLILNWRILICVSAAGLCTMLMVSIAPDQSWPWIVGIFMIAMSLIGGSIWEWLSTQKDY